MKYLLDSAGIAVLGCQSWPSILQIGLPRTLRVKNPLTVAGCSPNGPVPAWPDEPRTQNLRCGAAKGFPESLRRRATQKLSRSSLTFSRELARAMLAEQLYLAFATLAGHPYPK